MSLKRTLVALGLLALASTNALAQSRYVSPYVTRTGRVTNGYYRTAPDPKGTPVYSQYSNNYGSVGVTNPYTGATGHQTFDAYQKRRVVRAYRGYSRR